jgi:Glyoxalase-like domain
VAAFKSWRSADRLPATVALPSDSAASSVPGSSSRALSVLGSVRSDASGWLGSPGWTCRATFYVAVPDVEAALQRAEGLGGTRAMGPDRAPSGLVVGHFTDPEGNLIGLAATG